MAICQCGCGQEIPYGRQHKYKPPRFLHGHNMRGVKNQTHPSWRGGRVYKADGYVIISRPDHPAAWKHGYVFEHRLVMEQVLGRYLAKNESVHHLNGIRDDNRPENLVVLTISQHRTHHGQQKRHKATIELTCPICDKPFLANLRDHRQFCSRNCSGIAKQHPFLCAWCGKPFRRKGIRVLCCSRSCGAHLREQKEKTAKISSEQTLPRT